MSLTDEEREKVDALKRRQIFLDNRAEKYRIIELAEREFTDTLREDEEVLEADREAVDLVKIDLLAKQDAEIREAELLDIALTELEK